MNDLLKVSSRASSGSCCTPWWHCVVCWKYVSLFHRKIPGPSISHESSAVRVCKRWKAMKAIACLQYVGGQPKPTLTVCPPYRLIIYTILFLEWFNIQDIQLAVWHYALSAVEKQSACAPGQLHKKQLGCKEPDGPVRAWSCEVKIALLSHMKKRQTEDNSGPISSFLFRYGDSVCRVFDKMCKDFIQDSAS